MKKAANQELFFIFKALVDKRVPGLKSDLQRGETAIKRVAQLQKQIDNAQQYIDNNRYDRADALETRAEIAEYESEIARIRPICSKASAAGIELNAAKNFYHIYDDVEKLATIEKLRREYNLLESRADKLDDLIFSCEVNMNPFERSMAVCEQSAKDMEFYKEEYKQVSAKMLSITQKINKLKGR